MSCNINNQFVSVSGIGQKYLINQLEDNLKSYLDNGFLQIGGFVNINIPTSGLYQNSYSRLYPTQEPGYTNYRVWQSIKKDWVWESGISYNNVSPIKISGITVNGSGYSAPSGSGAYGFNINYALGRLVFNNALPSGLNIQCAHAYKWCQIYKSSHSPWIKELQSATYNGSQIQKTDTGDYTISSNHRLQMPCIVIEPISRTNMIPYQLGNNSFRINQDILLHVFADNHTDKNNIVDIIRLQKHRTIQLYDMNKINNIFGLNFNGNPINSGYTYNSIINNNHFKWSLCYLADITPMEMESVNFNLVWCTLRLTAEIIL